MTHPTAPRIPATAERHGRAKLTWWQVRSIRSLASSGTTRIRIAHAFGISERHVRKIISGEIWRLKP